MKRFVSVVVLLLGLCSVAWSQNRSYTVDDLLKVRRVNDPQLSPDGRHVAFTIGDVSFADNRVVNQIYVTPAGGGELKRLTDGKSSSSAPLWSPDGKKLAFYRFDESKVPDFYLATGLTRIQDSLDVEAYPKPGVSNPIVDLLVYDVDTKKTTRIDVRDGKPFDNVSIGHYVFRIDWAPSG